MRARYLLKQFIEGRIEEHERTRVRPQWEAQGLLEDVFQAQGGGDVFQAGKFIIHIS